MERLGDDAERTLAQAGGGGALALSRITEIWAATVGEAVARNAWPLRLGRDGTVHVATSSATWAFELDRLAPDLGERLREALGEPEPRRFRFQPGPIPEPGAAPRASREAAAEAPEAPPEVLAAADAAAAEIDDPDLRELVARAARASLASRRSGRSF
jgi:hypothetical protein